MRIISRQLEKYRNNRHGNIPGTFEGRKAFKTRMQNKWDRFSSTQSASGPWGDSNAYGRGTNVLADKDWQ